MSDAVIKAALEVAAAVDWAQRSGGDVKAWPMTHSRLAIAMCQQDRERAATTIAAFLRALPIMEGIGPDGKKVAVELKQMAAAVERAAGGGG